MPADWALLESVEAERAGRLMRRADRVRAVRGRAQLRRLLGEKLDLEPDALRFSIGAHGKPALEGGFPLTFNVAHGGHLLLVALDTRGYGIGIDVESRERTQAAAEVLGSLLVPLERRCAMPALRRWVAKEAVLKALGVGIAEHLESLAVTGRPGAEPDLHFDAGKTWPLDRLARASLRVWTFAPDAQHEAALCCRTAQPN
jgi:4'-phosphopantetheinyl transferase